MFNRRKKSHSFHNLTGSSPLTKRGQPCQNHNNFLAFQLNQQKIEKVNVHGTQNVLEGPVSIDLYIYTVIFILMAMGITRVTIRRSRI